MTAKIKTTGGLPLAIAAQNTAAELEKAKAARRLAIAAKAGLASPAELANAQTRARRQNAKAKAAAVDFGERLAKASTADKFVAAVLLRILPTEQTAAKGAGNELPPPVFSLAQIRGAGQ